MGEYLWDVKEHLLFDEEVKQMFDLCKTNHERLAVALMWRTGARPMEMIGEALKPKQINYTDTQVEVVLKTLKLGKGGRFKVMDRPLQFERPSGLEQDIYVETIVSMAGKTLPEEPLLPNGKRWLERLCNRLGVEVLGREISPYHFRHSRMTWLARNGATLDQLKHFKGSADYRSIWNYINAQPFVIKAQLSRAGEKRKELINAQNKEATPEKKEEPPQNINTI